MEGCGQHRPEGQSQATWVMVTAGHQDPHSAPDPAVTRGLLTHPGPSLSECVCGRVHGCVCVGTGVLSCECSKPAEQRPAPLPFRSPPGQLCRAEFWTLTTCSYPSQSWVWRPGPFTAQCSGALLQMPRYPAYLRGGGLARRLGQAQGPASVLTCLSSQAPALQQYRTSAGSPANQSPTSPVSNQGFSPGSSPQVRDAAPLPLPHSSLAGAPQRGPCAPVQRLCLLSHSTPSRSLHRGGDERAQPPYAVAKEKAPSPRAATFPQHLCSRAEPQLRVAGSPFTPVTSVPASPQRAARSRLPAACAPSLPMSALETSCFQASGGGGVLPHFGEQLSDSQPVRGLCSSAPSTPCEGVSLTSRPPAWEASLSGLAARPRSLPSSHG